VSSYWIFNLRILVQSIPITPIIVKHWDFVCTDVCSCIHMHNIAARWCKRLRFGSVIKMWTFWERCRGRIAVITHIFITSIYSSLKKILFQFQILASVYNLRRMMWTHVYMYSLQTKYFRNMPKNINTY